MIKLLALVVMVNSITIFLQNRSIKRLEKDAKATRNELGDVIALIKRHPELMDEEYKKQLNLNKYDR